MELGEWLAKGAAIAAVLFTVFTIVSSLIGVIGSIVTAVGVVVGVIGGPLTLVVLAVGAAIAAIIYYWDDIKAAGAAAGQWIKSVWDSAIGGIISMIDGIISKWNSFKGMISAGVNFIMGASSKIPSGAGGGGSVSQVNNITVNGARNPARAAATTVNGIRPVPRLSGVR